MNRTIKITESMLDLIGEIPLVRLNRIGRDGAGDAREVAVPGPLRGRWRCREWERDDAPAIAMARRLAEEEGMFCGTSSGANIVAAFAAAEHAGPGARVVTVLCDSRDRPLDEEGYIT